MKDRSLEETVALVQDTIGVEFNNTNLLIEAMTHCSFPNEKFNHPTPHYERLETMGDAVLELLVTDHLFRKDKENSEQRISEQRAFLVSAGALAKVGERLNLLDYCYMANGLRRDLQKTDGTKTARYIMSCLVESLLGAIYIDQGLGACRLFVDAFILTYASAALAQSRDYKSELQEMLQERFGIMPRYNTVSESGPDHARQFIIACMANDLELGRANGTNKKEGQIMSAKAALETINIWEGLVAEHAARRGLTMRHSRKGSGQ